MLLQTPVVLRGIRLGEVESLLLDGAEPRIVGFDVRCGDGGNRFLPFGAARRRNGVLEVDSALALLEASELAFYRTRGRSLTAAPDLADAVVQPGGALVIPLRPRC